MFTNQLLKQTKLLLPFLLLLYILIYITEQSSIDCKTLAYRNNWIHSIYNKQNSRSNNKLFQSRPSQTIASTANYKIDVLKSWPQATDSILVPTTTATVSNHNNALENLTQLIKYLRQNQDYVADKEKVTNGKVENELPFSMFKYNNYNHGLTILNTSIMKGEWPKRSPTTPVAIIHSKEELHSWNSPVNEINNGHKNNSLSFLLNKIKLICDLVKDVIPSQVNLSVKLPKLDVGAQTLQPTQATTDPSRTAYTAKGRNKKRSLTLRSTGKTRTKRKYRNSLTSSLSTLLEPLSMPIISAITATKSMLTVEETEGRHKHKKVKHKFKKFRKYLLPLLLAYKLKFLTLIPLLLGGLVLLVGTTGMAGFFFALFAAVMSLKSTSAFVK